MEYIKKCWDEIPLETLANLTKSMLKFCANVLHSNENACKYRVKYIWEKYESVLNLFPHQK